MINQASRSIPKRGLAQSQTEDSGLRSGRRKEWRGTQGAGWGGAAALGENNRKCNRASVGMMVVAL